MQEENNYLIKVLHIAMLFSNFTDSFLKILKLN
jgi:hypothetical protein